MMDQNTENNIREVKRLSVQALKDFDAFCKKHGLEYAIGYGTMLGAVRHGGFIPWDDDADVIMPIKDYRKLPGLWRKEYGSYSGNGYFLQTKRNSPYKPTLFYQLRKNGTTWIEPGKENVPIHWGIAIIDIFPVYHKPKSKFLGKVQMRLQGCAEKSAAVPYFRFGSIRKSAVILNNFISKFFSCCVDLMDRLSGKSGCVWILDEKKIFKNEWLFPAQTIGFEGFELSGVAEPDLYLTAQYGDYMTPPPEGERGGHTVGILDPWQDYSVYCNGENPKPAAGRAPRTRSEE